MSLLRFLTHQARGKPNYLSACTVADQTASMIYCQGVMFMEGGTSWVHIYIDSLLFIGLVMLYHPVPFVW